MADRGDYVDSGDETSSSVASVLLHSESDNEEGGIVFPHLRSRYNSVSDIEDELLDVDDGADNVYDAVPQVTDFREVQAGQDIAFQPFKTFTETFGPQNTPSPDSKPIEYFNLYFTQSLWSTFVNETNRYAHQYLASHKSSSHQRSNQWRPTTISEMRAFVAVLLEMGITRRPTILSYWAKNSRNIPWFGKMFPRNRFQLLLKFIHLVDNNSLSPPSNPDYNPFTKFEPLLEHANYLFKVHYAPHQHLRINESVIGNKSSSQSIENKNCFKFWTMCDSISQYCLGLYCVQGKVNEEEKADIKRNGLGHFVVAKLLDNGNYLGKWYHVVTNDFCSSIPLASYLFQHSTYLTGKLRYCQANIPVNLKENFEVGEAKYFRKNEVLLAAYRDKMYKKIPELMLSTHTVAKNKETRTVYNGQEKLVGQPLMVQNYNKLMGGINSLDTLLCNYIDRRRSMKQWKKVMFCIIEIMVMNAYILYKENTNVSVLSHLQFTSSIIESIEIEWLAVKSRVQNWGRSSSNDETEIVHQPGRVGVRKLPGRKERVCIVCSRKDGGKVRRSRTVCIQCGKGLHGICVSQHIC